MNRNIEKLLFITFGTAFGIYILLRAWLLPMTVDESATVINHVPRLVADTLFFKKEANPNNHILNTIAIKTFAGLFGWHPIVVRLPVLIGAGFYLWASVHLSKKISEKPEVRLFAFFVLLANPYLLEFFSLARGYGLAEGLMLMAVWQAWRFLGKNQKKHLRSAFIFAGLAVYANFTLLVFYAPFAVLLLLVSWQLNPSFSIFWQKTKPALLTLGIFAALWYEPVRKLSKDSEIEKWTALGSLFGSMEQSVKAATHGHAYLGGDTVRILTWLAILFCVGVWLVAIWRWWRQGRRFAADPRLFLIALLPAALITNVLQVHLTGTPYLQSRLALFYYPLFALHLDVAAAWLWPRWERRTWIFMAPVLLLATLNLARCVNLTKSSEWWFDQGTYRVLDFLKKTYETEGRSEPIALDAHHVMLNSFIFHLERDPRGYDKYVKLAPWHGLQPPSRDYEFFYAINADEVKDIMDAYEVVLHVPETSFILVRKKR
jgi:hypothetical protein